MSRHRYHKGPRPVAPKPQPVVAQPVPPSIHPEPEGPSAQDTTQERQPKYQRIRL